MAQDPWYRRCYRWGQTNITEIDPTRYDIPWWREHWRRTRIQGVIINAGGIFSYYPSRLPLTHYAEHLGERDLFGELTEAARSEGLAVLARMDSNRIHPAMAQAHPDWAAIDAQGQPYRAGDTTITCVHSAYYQEYLPEVLREIARTYHPDGFTDNSFSGLGRDRISYSPSARQAFLAASGLELPPRVDWDDPRYRQWIQWSYARRQEIWELNNTAAREAGGPDCLWIGMVSGNFVQQGAGFRDLKAILERTPIALLDFQARPEGASFAANSEAGLLLHNLLGWDKLLPESMAMYEHAPREPFRIASKPEGEARLWALAGFAGGIQPWWHHIGAYHEDRRQYRTAEPLFRWHEQNQAYLLDRRPLAPVGLVWSHENADFYGRDQAHQRVEQPWQGFAAALTRARIPYQPVHIDHIRRDAHELSLLVLPNLGGMEDGHIQAVRDFVENGGSLIASGEAGRYDRWGDLRPDVGLGDVLGVRHTGQSAGSAGPGSNGWEGWQRHSYLRLYPELRAGVYGPHTGSEPPVAGERHPALAGFEETDLLPFGGRLEAVEALAGATAPLRYCAPFPVYPPETAWMRAPEGTWPALVLREHPGGGRSAYLAADIDRCYARNPLPDYQRLLANIVRWAAGDSLPLEVTGTGLLSCQLYRQGARRILHLLNLTGTEARPVHELIPVGPLQVRLRPGSAQPKQARLLVAGKEIPFRLNGGWLECEIETILDHEVLVVE